MTTYNNATLTITNATQYLLGSKAAPVTTSTTGSVVYITGSSSNTRIIGVAGTITGDATVTIYAINPDFPSIDINISTSTANQLVFDATTGGFIESFAPFPSGWGMKAVLDLGDTGTASIRAFVV